MLTEQQIREPFKSHEQLLQEMYRLEGFTVMLQALIEACRRDLADMMIAKEGEMLIFNRRQGEMFAYKKLLERSKQAFIKGNSNADYKKG